MKDTDNNKSPAKLEFKEAPPINKIPLLSSNNLENAIKNLSKPRFLGSIHLKEQLGPRSNSIENLIDSELKLKITKSLKNTLLNPLTKILIISSIIFYLIWFLLVFIF